MSGNLPKSLESQQITQPTSEQSSELNHANLRSHSQVDEDSSLSTPIQTASLCPTLKRKRRFTLHEAATQKFLELEKKKTKLLYEENEKNTDKCEHCHSLMTLIPHMAQFNSAETPRYNSR
jgi:hypothetical protein